jgi:gamma-glutamylcyclotransferase (GGCT)/AIG2-like uncharacterized protein YtfP
MEPNLLFVYGILKRGECLDLEKYGAKFIGPATVEGVQLYHIGSGVGAREMTWRCNDPRHEHVAHGEVFEIPDNLWPWLDRIESNGFAYTRKVMSARLPNNGGVMAWIYIHTYPGMVYDKPVEGNDWREM